MKKWCTSPSDPLVKQISKKYNVSEKDAKTILNTAKRDNPALQESEVSMDFLESQETFQEALAAFADNLAGAEHFLLKDPGGKKEAAEEYQEELRNEFGLIVDKEDIEDMVEAAETIRVSTRTSKLSAQRLAKVVATFKDPRRLDFLGNWICCVFSDYVTRFEFDSNLRKRLGIKKHGTRKEYFNDINVVNAIRREILGDGEDYVGILEVAANGTEKKGMADLTAELDAVLTDPNLFNTILYMYGGTMFREEGVKVGMDGNFISTDYAADSSERNDIDTQEEDDDMDDETPITVFSSSDQNKSVYSKIVPNIKALLHNMRDMKSGRKYKTDEFGYGLWTYVSVPQAVNKLLRLCENCDSFSEMMNILKANRRSTPWLGQLITALDDKVAADPTGQYTISSSKKEQLQTMFWKSFNKHSTKFRHSYQTYDEQGDIVYVGRDSNVKHKAEQLMRQVRKRFTMKSGSSIFNDGKINFKEIEKINSSLIPSRGMEITKTVQGKILAAQWEADAIKRRAASTPGSKVDFETAYEKLEEAKKEVSGILEALGLKVSDQTLSDFVANNPNSYKKDTERKSKSAVQEEYETIAAQTEQLESLLQPLKRLTDVFLEWKAAQDKKETTDTEKTNPFSREATYQDIRKIRNWYERITEALTEFSPDGFESMTHVNKKDYYGWNNPSFVSYAVKHLQSKDVNRRRAFIMNKYGKDALWYMKQGSTKNEPHFYSDVLEDLYYGKGAEVLDYSEVLAFAGTTYKDMSDVAYALNMLNDFFSVRFDANGIKKDRAWYRMLIASDKPRYSTLRLKRYSDRSETDTEFGFIWSEENYHNVIARKAVDFLTQEILRAEDVIKYAAKGRGTRVSDYDIDRNDKRFKAVFDKIKRGEEITVDDVVVDGRYVFRNTGASFFLNKFINEEIEKKTTLGRFIVDRIFNTHMQTEKREVLTPAAISDFKKGFHKYMQSLKEETSKRLDEVGLYADRTQPGSRDEGPTVHLKYLVGNMRNWHQDEDSFYEIMYGREEQARKLAESEGYDLSQQPELYSYFCERVQFDIDLEEYIYNNWLAKANMSELFDVDFAFYGDTTNFQKRNAQMISSGFTADPEARLHGNPVSDGYYRSITLVTNKKEVSAHLKNIRSVLKRRLKQISDPLQARQFALGMKATLSALDGFDSTDGQAFVGLTALRKRLVGQGEWSRSDDKNIDIAGYITDKNNNKIYVYTDEAVYQRMKRGYAGEPDEVKTNDLLHVFAQPQKDFVYTIANMKRAGRGMISVPTQHKNSEYMLSFLSAFSAIEEPKSQTAAIARFLEETAEANDTIGIDTVNFDSAVKIGGTSEAINIIGLSGQETLEALRRAVYKTENGKKETTVENKYKDNVVTTYGIEDYRIVQEKPEHFKHSAQPAGSQKKVLSINNIPDTAIIKLGNGKEITGKELKKRYFKALRKKARDTERGFVKEFGLLLPHNRRIHRVANAIKDAMSTDQKFTSEMRRALSVTERNGEEQFVIPLDDPSNQSAIEALLYSKLRRLYYKQKTNGGIAVQATAWGEAEDLHIRFYSSNPEDKDGLIPVDADQEYCDTWQQGYAYFEIEAPMPDYVKKMIQNKDGSIDKKYFLEDGNWNMEEIRKVVPDSAFDAICYRVPTEAKYSIMACRIVRFAKEGSGSVLKFPKDLTVFTGSDFDIDTDTVELRPIPGSGAERIDQELFDLQYAALRSDPAIGETFKPGDFSDLSEASYYLTLLESGIAPEILDKMTTKELKNKCKEVEDLDLMSPLTDIILRNQNMDAKDMIGIAAVGVTSHAFFSLYNDVEPGNPEKDPAVSLDNFVRVYIKKADGEHVGESCTIVNDKDADNVTTHRVAEEVILDPLYDMDGKLISTEISKYVGASADAAKDAALYRLGLNKNTLPIAIFMHRIGISSDVIRAFMKQPIVKQVLLSLNQPSQYGYNSIDDACTEVLANIIDNELKGLTGDKLEEERKRLGKIWEDVKRDPNRIIRYSDLRDNIQNPKGQSIGDKMKVLYMLNAFADNAKQVRALDGFVRYNSANAMKGSSFLDRLATRNRLTKLANTLANENSKFRLPKNIEVSAFLPEGEFGKLCAMFPHVGQTVMGENRLTDELILEHMHTYSPAFFEAIKYLQIEDDAEEMKKLYEGWKNYLFFVSENRIADFRDRGTAIKYTRGFAAEYAEKLKELEKNKDIYSKVIEGNTFLDSISFVDAKEGYGNFQILRTDIIGLRGQELEQYKKDWEALLQYPETRQFAIDITIHFLAQAAAFNRNTPIHIMPNAIKEAIPNYLSAMSDADKLSVLGDELDAFIVMYCRNNASNKKIVPHIRNTKDRVLAEFKETDPEAWTGVLTVNTNTAISKWFTEKDEAGRVRLKAPIVSIENANGEKQLFLVVDDSIRKREGDKDFIEVDAMIITPLGIPNQIAEYTGTEDSQISIMLDPNQDAPDADAADETTDDSTPVIEDGVSTALGESLLETMPYTRTGSWVDTNPFDYNADVEAESLARDAADNRPSIFLESRTHLRRAEKIASLLGIKISAAPVTDSPYGDSYYSLSIIDSKFGEDTHSTGKKFAALLGALGYMKGMPTVKTYTRDIESANGFEITYRLEGDRRDTQDFFSFSSDALGDRLAELKAQVAHIERNLKDTGKKVKGNVEVNLIVYDELIDEDIINILKDIRDEEREDNSERGQRTAYQEFTGLDGRSVGKQDRYYDLVALAIRREEGEKVDDELREAFGEQWNPLQKTTGSYASTKLASAVLENLDQGVNDAIEVMLSENTIRATASEKVDNLIVNVANWILGNRPTDTLMRMLGESGFTEKNARAIIATIQNELEKQDIC